MHNKSNAVRIPTLDVLCPVVGIDAAVDFFSTGAYCTACCEPLDAKLNHAEERAA